MPASPVAARFRIDVNLMMAIGVSTMEGRTLSNYGGNIMGSRSGESFEDFLESLKQAGIAIRNESELRQRLAEAQRWQFAFATLAAHGKTLGIQFINHREGANDAQLWNTFARFDFPMPLQAAFAASLKSEH